MLSKMKSRSNEASLKLKAACSTFATKMGQKSRKEQRVRKCVVDLLQLYDPDKVSTVDKLMDEWKHREMALLQHLHQQYHLTDVGLTYFKSKYSRLFELEPIYKGSFCRQCVRRSNGELRLYHRIYKKRVSVYTTRNIKSELNVLRKLNHKHILRLYDIFESRTRLVLITDLLDYSQCALATALRQKSQEANIVLTESLIACLFQQMLNIVAYLHSKNLVHCNMNLDSFVIDNWRPSSSSHSHGPIVMHQSDQTLDDDDDAHNDDTVMDHDEKTDMASTQTVPPVEITEPFLKLIRVDQCVFLPDLSSRSEPFTVTHTRFAPPEILQFDKTNICETSDSYSLGVLLYVMLCGCLPKQVPMHALNRSSHGVDFKLELDHHKQAWHALSFHARDLITKLVHPQPQQRLSVTRCFEHPWMVRYQKGYLQQRFLGGEYAGNLRNYLCMQKLQNGIRKLLLLKDCMGLMNDCILIDHARAVVNQWSRQFERQNVYHIVVPFHVKEIIVDFT